MYLVFSLLIAMSLAYGVNAEVVSGNCGEDGDNVKWELDTENGVLTISGQGDMWDYEYQYDYSGGYTTAPWYSCYPGISTVVIQNGITSIGDYAFCGCTGLTNVTIPDGVRSIGICAFNKCTGLTNVTIPDSVTSIGMGVFNRTGLTSIVIPDSVTSIGYAAFADSIGLTSVTIPDSVRCIGNGAFSGCTGLTNVTIPDGVTSIGDSVFYACTGLMNVTIPGSVTSIGDAAFRGCTGLMSVTIPGSVTSIGDDAFSDCTGLTNVTILDGVTSIGDSAFSCCTGLTNITIPDSVTSIGDCAFAGCTGLASIVIPDSVTSIGIYAFNNTPWYKAKPDGLIYINRVLYDSKGLLYNRRITPGTVSISGYALWDCTEDINFITVPDSVTSIGGSAFREIPCWYDAKPNGLVYINKVLYKYNGNMPSNTKIDITPGTVSISDHAFYDYTNLTSVTIPDSVISIGNAAFSGCTGLTNVTIPDGVTSIGNHVFASCTGLTNITIPDGVTSIGNSAFFGCTGLTSVTIPAGVAKMSVLAFDSTQLTDIYYGGTETEWKNMMNMVGGGNDPLFQATLHCVPELPNQLVLTIGQRTAHAFGHTKINDVAPVVVNGRTMLPVRFLAENLGATVAWNEEKQLVTITGKNQNQEDVTIFITIGAANAQINGQSVALEAPAFVDQNRTFMPVRLIAEALGASVDWKEAEQKVIITKM